MRKVLKTASGTNIIVEDKSFASGGEGAIHKIVTPTYKDYCVKLYTPKYCTKEREKKILYMVQNLPTQLQSENYTICWAKEAMYDTHNQFVGFMMPLAYSDSIQLYELCMLKAKKGLPAVWQNKYDRTNVKGLQARLKLCVNIASAIHSIHSLQKYTLVDMKPQNMLITHDGKISIIDLDSIQIAESKQVLFSAQVATPEYVPTEGNKLNPSQDYIPETWDRFSLAVIFYEIIFGIHPYTATFKFPYQNCDTVPSKIEKGLFVHGTHNAHIQVLPPPHKNFELLPYNIKKLFLLAFEEGNKNPSLRPMAENWGKTLFEEIGKDVVALPTKTFKPTIKEVNKPVEEGYYTENKRGNGIYIPPTKTNLPANTSSPNSNSSAVFSFFIVLFIIVITIFLTNTTTTQNNQEQTIPKNSIEINSDVLLSKEIIGNWVWENKEEDYGNIITFEDNGNFMDRYGNKILEKGKWKADNITRTLMLMTDSDTTVYEECNFDKNKFYFKLNKMEQNWIRNR